MTTPDGVIVINTKINDSGFNTGIKKVQVSALNALNKVLLPMVKIGDKVQSVLTGLMGSLKNGLAGLVAGLFVAFALSVTKIFAFLREAVQEAIALDPKLSRQVEEIQNSFVDLKHAIGNAFLPLIQAAIPYIKMALSWLIELFNKVAMITAAFLGQKNALQIIQGSAQKIADANKKTEKAARGQLAAFDQINVLQEQETDTTDTSNLPKVAAELVPITDDILSKVQAIKEEIAAWFADPIGKLKETWGMLVDWFKENVINPIADWWKESWIGKIFFALWENFTSTWKRIFANTVETFKNVKANIIQALTGVIEFIVGIFTGNWSLVWQGLVNIATGVIGALSALVRGMFENWKILLGGWITQFKIVWEAIGPWFTDRVINPLRNAFASFISWLETNVVAPLRNKFNYAVEFIRGAFESLVNWLRDTFGNAFSNIGDIARGAFNGLIDIINGLLNRIATAMNNMAGIVNQFSWMLGGMHIPTVSAPNIPHLATGAVIPPNAEFLAVMGDQKSGRNIEAPENLIRQIMREEMGNQNSEVALTNVITLDGEVLFQNHKRVSARHGNSLLSGGNV